MANQDLETVANTLRRKPATTGAAVGKKRNLASPMCSHGQDHNFNGMYVMNNGWIDHVAKGVQSGTNGGMYNMHSAYDSNLQPKMHASYGGDSYDTYYRVVHSKCRVVGDYALFTAASRNDSLVRADRFQISTGLVTGRFQASATSGMGEWTHDEKYLYSVVHQTYNFPGIQIRKHLVNAVATTATLAGWNIEGTGGTFDVFGIETDGQENLFIVFAYSAQTSVIKFDTKTGTIVWERVIYAGSANIPNYGMIYRDPFSDTLIFQNQTASQFYQVRCSDGASRAVFSSTTVPQGFIFGADATGLYFQAYDASTTTYRMYRINGDKIDRTYTGSSASGIVVLPLGDGDLGVCWSASRGRGIARIPDVATGTLTFQNGVAAGTTQTVTMASPNTALPAFTVSGTTPNAKTLFAYSSDQLTGATYEFLNYAEVF